MGWECFCVVGFDLGPLLQGQTRILHLQYFFKYVLTYFLHLTSYVVTFLHNTICRAQLFCPFYILFTHVVRMGGWGGQWEKVCPGCISDTVRCRKLILGRDIG